VVYSIRSILLALLLIGCDGITPPSDVTPLEPPPIYRTWYAEVEACVRDLDITPSPFADYDRLVWFTYVDGLECGRLNCSGLWKTDGRVYIRSALVNRVDVVKHEILHEILHGDADHSRPPWEVCPEIL
jgi:hypothetical protein